MTKTFKESMRALGLNKLKPLQRIIVSNDEDGTQVSRLPNNQEMMNKINEIINHINKYC